MTFEKALELIKQGKRLQRKGWNGKGMHVEMVDLFTSKNVLVNNKCLLLFNASGTFNTWIPSITDLFAEDWMLVE